MSNYVDNVKKNVAGQGIVQELATPPHSRQEVTRRDTPSPPPSPPPSLPPPPMELLKTNKSTYTAGGVNDINRSDTSSPIRGTFYAEPYKADRRDSYNKPVSQSRHLQPQHLPHYNHHHHHSSTGSSPASSPSPPQLLPSPPLPTTTNYKQRDWTCFGCSEIMQPGSVAIFAERAGYDSKGQLFCGRDFAQLMNIPRCQACDELIFSTEYTGAEGGTWHLKHFCCLVCDAPLAGHKYIAEGGQPHCLPCWQHHHGKVCGTCGQVIDPQGQRMSLGDQHWHVTEECFRCGVCNRSLLGGKVSKRGDTLLCSSICGQQLIFLKQQQASLYGSTDGLVPGLAKLGVNETSTQRQDFKDMYLAQQRPGSSCSVDSVRTNYSRSNYSQSSAKARHLRGGSASSEDSLPPPPRGADSLHVLEIGELPPPPLGGDHKDRGLNYSTIV